MRAARLGLLVGCGLLSACLSGTVRLDGGLPLPFADGGLDAGTADGGPGSIGTPDAGLPDAGPTDGGARGDAGWPTYGDRDLGVDIAYPGAVFVQDGGFFIDVTRPPAGLTPAVGDGRTDDTAAFQDVFDFLKAAFVASGGPGSLASQPYWVYVPNGTYLVSDTLCYRGPSLEPDGGYTWYDLTNVRFVGESRERTVIKLADRTAGFGDKANPKILFAFQHPATRFNNLPTLNLLENLTLDVGAGNPGAVGLFFQGANLTGMDNVKVTSEDGQGAYGIWFKIGSVQGAYRDITVQGFDEGIFQSANAEVDEAFEHLTLRGQAVAGALVQGGGMTLRAVEIDERATGAAGLRVEAGGAQVVVIDSQLQGGGSAPPALDVTDSTKQMLFARHVAISGFDAGLTANGQVLAAGSISGEVGTDAPIVLFPGQPTTSIDLPALDTPLVPWFDPATDWANVADFGAVADGVTDDTAAINAALASGAKVVYFPRANYEVTGALNVPASVQRIELLAAHLSSGLTEVSNARFQVAAAASTPLLVRGAVGYGAVVLASARDVVLQQDSIGFDNPGAQRQNVFLENVANIGSSNDFDPPGERLYARSLNDEQGGLPDGGFTPGQSAADIRIAGGLLWLLNDKTENKAIPSLSASQGAVVEVLGGYVNVTQAPGPVPLISNDGSNVAYLGFTNLFCGEVQTAIQELRDGGVALATPAQLPNRGEGGGCYVVPLYLGYDPAHLP